MMLDHAILGSSVIQIAHLSPEMQHRKYTRTIEIVNSIVPPMIIPSKMIIDTEKLLFDTMSYHESTFQT